MVKYLLNTLRLDKKTVFFLLSLFFVRGSLANWYYIPSGSMLPTLEVGDFVFVNRTAYALHLPFTRISLARRAEPKLGEIVVFDGPNDGPLMVKRLIAVPGDHVAIKDGQLRVNGERICLPDCDRRTAGLFDFVVPAESYFVLGDNRENSADSRSWGLLPRSHLVGRGWGLLALNRREIRSL